MMHRLDEDEQGVALVSVIGVSFILTLLVTAALAYAVGAMPQAERHEDWNHALAAAEAGLEDYIYRLNRNPGYYSTATEASPNGNAALDAWAPLAGSDAQGEFHYDVDASAVNSTGAIDLTVTGRVDGVTRSITARVRPEGFLDYIYFTNYETIDDGDTVYWGNQSGCDDWYWNRSGSCAGIRFVTGDEINGPLRTNDAMLIDGDPVFTGTVETQWTGEVRSGTTYLWRDQTFGNTSDPDFQQGISTSLELSKPPTNLAIRDQTTSATGGCNYYGPTYIRVDGDRMWVRSPLSASAPSGEPATNGSCAPGSWANGGYVDIPDNGVIYVSNHTTNPSSHPLGMTQGNTGDITTYDRNAGDLFVWGTVDDQVTFAAQNDIYVVWDLLYANGIAGDELTGLVAQNFVNVYHPIRCTGQDVDCENRVRGRAPFDPPGSSADDPVQPGADPLGGDYWATPDIHAAIITIDHSFRVQNWRWGSYFNRFTTAGTPDLSTPATSGSARGDLTVLGAIAQEFRGVVGTGGANAGTGYLKDYVYDDRLKFLSPPFFIQPEESQWVPRQWAEIQQPGDLP